MSEPANSKATKVSREGLALIRSLEGFRPRAQRREDGGWVIGYGHTLSAREGAQVSTADADLLLQYDLLPVVKVLQGVAAPLNQHQFDALASFVMNIGVEAFEASDVKAALAAGHPARAARAMAAWREGAVADPVARRRAAERALFVLDPERPATLAELLAAPMVEAEPQPARPDARAAAVAALLGEVAAPGVEHASDRVVVPFTRAAPAPEPEPEPEVSASPTEPETIVEDENEAAETASGPEPMPAQEPAAANDGDAAEDTGSKAGETVAVLSLQRYSPYPAAILGPLPEAAPASMSGPADEAENPTVLTGAETPPASLTLLSIEPPEPIHIIRADPPSEGAAAAAGAAAESAPLAPEVEAALAEQAPILAVDPAVTAPEPLVLTPAPETTPSPTREAWPESARPAADAAVEPLFEEESLDQRAFGALVRNEGFDAAGPRFGWGDTGAFVAMGGVGLVAFGAAMAGFRMASQDPGGGGDPMMIAWVLALIGAICVGVSAYNLYRRLGRMEPRDDVPEGETEA